MNAAELSQIQERLTKATPGPWYWEDRQPKTLIGGSRWEHSTSTDDVIYIEHREGSWSTSCSTDVEMEAADAEFIAHSRVDVEKLLEEVDRLIAERDSCARMHAEAVNRSIQWMDHVMQNAAKGDWVQLIEDVGDDLNEVDAVDDESIVLWNKAKAQAVSDQKQQS